MRQIHVQPSGKGNSRFHALCHIVSGTPSVVVYSGPYSTSAFSEVTIQFTVVCYTQPQLSSNKCIYILKTIFKFDFYQNIDTMRFTLMYNVYRFCHPTFSYLSVNAVVSLSKQVRCVPSQNL